MVENTKIDLQCMLDRLRPGESLLPPIVIRDAVPLADRAIDALIEVSFAADNALERFYVECKTRSTPDAFRKAIEQASDNAKRLDCHPLIFLPFLSPDRLKELEDLAVSGIDLCGNGFVYVPNHLCVLRIADRPSKIIPTPDRSRILIVVVQRLSLGC